MDSDAIKASVFMDCILFSISISFESKCPPQVDQIMNNFMNNYEQF